MDHNLSPLILVNILKRLSLREKIKCELVCRSFKKAVDVSLGQQTSIWFDCRTDREKYKKLPKDVDTENLLPCDDMPCKSLDNIVERLTGVKTLVFGPTYSTLMQSLQHKWLDMMSGHASQIQSLTINTLSIPVVLPHLKRIKAGFRKRKALDGVLNNCPNLRCLDVDFHQTSISAADFVAKLPNGITHLRMRNCYTGTNLYSSLLNCTVFIHSLVSLVINPMDEDDKHDDLDEEIPRTQSQRYPLEKFVLGSPVTFAESSDVAQVIRVCKNLKHLKVIDLGLTVFEFADCIKGHRVLTNVYLPKVFAKNSVIVTICNNSRNSLEKLEGLLLDDLKSSTLKEIAKCPNLSYLARCDNDDESRKKIIKFLNERQQVMDRVHLEIEAICVEISSKIMKAARKADVEFVDKWGDDDDISDQESQLS